MSLLPTPPGVPGAQFAKDANGNVIGLIGPGNKRVMSTGKRAGVVLMGDSINANNQLPISVTLTNNGDGTATATAASLKVYQGDTVSFGGSPTPVLNQLNTTILSHTIVGGLVTSVTYSLGGTYGPSVQSGGTTMTVLWQSSDNGIFSFARALSGVPIRVLANFSVGGSNSDDMYLLLEQALALNPSVVWIQIGTNNRFAVQWTAAQSIASIKKCIDRIAQCGATPVLQSIPPRSDSGNSFALTHQNDATDAANVAPVLKWANEYMPKVGGYFIDLWRGVCNGVSFSDLTSTLLFANLTMLKDGVHPERRGAVAGGKVGAPVARSLFPVTQGLPVGPAFVNANGKTFFDNSMLTGSGTATGLTISTVAGSPTVTPSLVPRTEAADGDIMGNWQRIVITGATSGTQVRVRVQVAPSSWAFGDYIEAAMKVRVSSSATPGSGAPVGMSTPELAMTVTTATTGGDVAYDCANQTPGAQVDEAYTMLLNITPHNFKAAGSGVHGALSNIRLDLNLYFRGTGSATVDLCQVVLGAIDASLL